MRDTHYRQPDLRLLPRSRLESMLQAGQEVRDCYRELEKSGSNIVSEVLRGQGALCELSHYPVGDVCDSDSGGQYYYHWHRSNECEHGHFHTFLRTSDLSIHAKPVPYTGDEPWPHGDEALLHLIGISMSKTGFPVGLFATNRWVTGGTWYPAGDVIRMLELFSINHEYPSWQVNRWISAMIRFYYPQIAELLQQRDRVIEAWAEKPSGEDVHGNLKLEMTGSIEISDREQFEAVGRALAEVS